MVNIAFYAELNFQICNYAQKRRICRENSKYAWQKFHGHFCPRRKAANFCHPVVSVTISISITILYMMANTMCLLHDLSFSASSSYFVININIIKNRHLNHYHQYWLIKKWNSLFRVNSCIEQQQKESAFDLLNVIITIIIIAPVWDVQCNQDVAEAVSKFRSEKLQLRFFSEAKSSVDTFAILLPNILAEK